MTAPANLPAHVVKHGPWSISKLGVIEQCTLKFDYKYGPEKVKEPPTDNTESLTGIIVHRALELALDNFPVKHAFRQALDENPVLSDQRDQIMSFFQQVERMVKTFANLRVAWGVKGDIHSVMIERKWGLTADFKNAEFFARDVFFRGVVDYALLTAKNNVVIVDHKTGKERDLSYYENQFRAYCLLALAKMPTLKAVQTGINFVLNDRLLWSPKAITAEQIRDEYQPWLLAHINKTCEGLTKPPEPNVQRLCDWCGYKPYCPGHGGAGRGAIPQE